MDFNEYYNYLNGYSDMNYLTNPNQFIENLNYQSLLPNNNTSSNNIISTEEGFKRGNMFRNLYDEYKNYKPKNLTASNEKEDMLMQIREYNFAMTDLNLYLDIYPNDSDALKLFNTYLDNKKGLVDMYEKKYGPLTIDSDDQKNNWLWDNSPWPWEVQK